VSGREVEKTHAEYSLLSFSVELARAIEDGRTDRNVGGKNAIVTTAIVFKAALSSLAASPKLFIT
jgi:hypothetical protein